MELGTLAVGEHPTTPWCRESIIAWKRWRIKRRWTRVEAWRWPPFSGPCSRRKRRHEGSALTSPTAWSRGAGPKVARCPGHRRPPANRCPRTDVTLLRGAASAGPVTAIRWPGCWTTAAYGSPARAAQVRQMGTLYTHQGDRNPAVQRGGACGSAVSQISRGG